MQRLFFIAVAGVLSSAAAHAAVYRVGSGAGCTHASIQAAIDAAEATAADDDIFISGASYASQALAIENARGALALIGGYDTCRSATPTLGAHTLISGTGSQSTLRVTASPRVELLNLDIQNGHPAGVGGGVRARGSDGVLRLFNTWVRGNQAPSGGGIAVENTDLQAAPDRYELRLEGDSRALSNAATATGGGIHCQRATLSIRDASFVGQNTSGGAGGGIYAVDCRVRIGSRGLNGGGAVLWGNATAAGDGGGLFLIGTLAEGDFYSVDPLVPARVVGNSASTSDAGQGRGGGIALGAGARMRVYDAVIAQNTADYGGAIALSGGIGETRAMDFQMQAALDGAPAAAVRCADPEACNLVRGNRARSSSGAPHAGAVAQLFTGNTGTARARFTGTRMDGNEGSSLAFLWNDGAELELDGGLVVGNRATGALISTYPYDSRHTVTLRASTIADNGLLGNFAVIDSAARCADIGGAIGVSVRRSIVRETGHALVNDSAPQADCFTHVIANDFGSISPAPDRVVADPGFVDAAHGDYRLRDSSSALDFAPATPADATRDGGARVVDLGGRTDLFGPQDAGAYEYAVDTIFVDGFDGSGTRR